MLIQTIATVSYLPFIAVLINSIKAHCKNMRFSVLVTDVSPEMLPEIKARFDRDIELLCGDDLNFEFLPRMRRYYDILEFNAACKILAINFQFLAKKVNECLCLDADMYALGDISDFFKDKRRDIVLTPHVFSPYPLDGHMPSDMEIIARGHINAGLIYFKKTDPALRALDWLKENTKFNWFIAPAHGMHAEQQWLTALPFLFNACVEVSFDPAVNIGYWNLHERGLLWEGGTYKVNENRVALVFHFSGFSTPSYGKLSRHTDRKSNSETQKALSKIISEYEGLLMREMAHFKGLKGDLGFCQCPIYKRMKYAEDYWKIKYYRFDTREGFFERIGLKLDRLL